jgi:hypothetical protein
VLVFWILYGIVHSALRLSISRTLTLDDARANELAQTLSLGYQLRQPPLYEWLLWFSQRFFGPGIESRSRCKRRCDFSNSRPGGQPFTLA